MLTNFFTLIFILLSVGLQAQLLQYNKIFHPQTKENIAVMKKSPQKQLSIYATWEGAKMQNDSDNYLQEEHFYNKNGRLILNKNLIMYNWVSYKYNKKGQVVEYHSRYLDKNDKGKSILYFAVSYTKKGAMKSIVNLDKTKRAKSISYNPNTKTILISDAGGYIYRYTLDKKNRLIQAKVEYQLSIRYNATFTYNKKGLLIEEMGTRELHSTTVNFTAKHLYKKGKIKTINTIATPQNTISEIKSVETYAYNNNSLLRFKERVVDNTGTISYTYLYDGLNRKIKTMYIDDGKLMGEEFFVYR